LATMHLRTVRISEGVISIGDYAFANCPNLVVVTFLGDEPEFSFLESIFEGASYGFYIQALEYKEGWIAYKGDQWYFTYTIEKLIAPPDGYEQTVTLNSSDTSTDLALLEWNEVEGAKTNSIVIDSIKFNGTPLYGAPSSFSINASGNLAGVQYAYYIKKWNGKDWDFLRRDAAYSTTNSFSYTFPSAGTYSIQGFAKNSAGDCVSKDYVFTLNPLAIDRIELNGIPLDGTPLSFSIKTSGDSKVDGYAYYLKEKIGADWHFLSRDATYYATNTFDINYLMKGTYCIQGFARNTAGEYVSMEYEFTIKSLIITDIVVLGRPMYGTPTEILIVTSSYFQRFNEYAYYIKKWNGTDWDFLSRDATYYPTHTFCYTFPSAGTYRIQGFARNTAGEYDSKEIEFTLKPLAIDRIMFNDTRLYGTPTSFSIITSGDSDVNGYAYYIKKWNGTDWDFLRRDATYYETNTFSYTFPSAGTYRIQGFAKNTAGEYVSKEIELTLKPLAVDSIMFKGNGAPPHGKQISFSIITSGDSRVIQYAYYITKKAYNNMPVQKPHPNDLTYSKINTFYYTFPSAGTYHIIVYAKGSNGEMPSLEYDITVQ